ncbi:hypothetical protein BDF22DRAFT_656555 [Syncephalis plumigaleata]|nr:hypothetical protein BDF22DRAFT_656555 [Syncephalis plumigaleata]
MSSDNDHQRASTAWTGPMPEPSIPTLNAYAAPASTFTSTDAASSSPSLVPAATEVTMPDAAHYVRPNAYATPYDNPSMTTVDYPSHSDEPAKIATTTNDGDDGTVVVVPAPAQILEHTGGHGLAAPLSPNDPHFQNTSNDYKLNGAGPTSGSAIPAPPTQRQVPHRVILIIRIIQLVASVGTLGFLAGASSYSGESSPFSGRTAVDLYYVVSSISCAVSLFLLGFMLLRWIKPGRVIGQYTQFLIDLIMACIWGADVFIIIGTQKCPVGSRNGWCDFFNTSIFFGVVAFLTYAMAMGWDVYFNCCGGNRGRLSEGLRGKRWRRN